MPVPALLASVGLPFLIKTIRSALSKSENRIAKGASEALDSLDKAITSGDMSLDEVKEANRHIEALAQSESDEFKTLITEVNQSLRAETVSEDSYVRRMRPTFGYIMAVTWAAQMLAVAYVILFEPEKSGDVMNGMASLSAIWTVGLSVLGIYVYKRSKEKEMR